MSKYEKEKKYAAGWNLMQYIARFACLPLRILKKTFSQKTVDFISYPTWEDAETASTGYDSDDVIGKVRESAKRVYEGKAAYERDSVIFDHIQYSYPLLAAILFAMASSEHFRVIDFGGALGTTFQQNRRFLKNLSKKCEWRIVEQDKFVHIGNSEFADEYLSFYNSIDEAAKNGFDAILFCGSICYVPNAYDYLRKAIELNAPFIIFDRTPITMEEKDTFAVQHVPPSIYKASYPIRNFSYKNFLKIFQQDYELIEKWVCDLQADSSTTAMGFIFKRNKI